MTLAGARALCANLEALPWDDAAVAAAITESTAAFVQASPQVSPVSGAPGMWWIGASGFAAHGAGTSGERAFARALHAIACRWHPRARVAIANSCVAARAATWSSTSSGDQASICIIPPGGDARYLASAPLTLIPMDGEIRDALRALGVRIARQFADLGAGDVEQRWGEEGLVAWRLARGDDPRRPVLARPDDTPHVELELSTPAESMEPVLFLVRPAVERLATQLVGEGRAIASLAITLTLDDARGALPTARAHTVTREIRLPRPMARSAPLFERCRGLLAQWTLTAPVTAVRVTVVLMSPLTGDQGNLLDTSWRDPGAADAALERVRAELGYDSVVKPHGRDGYAVERSGEWSDVGNGKPQRRESGERERTRTGAPPTPSPDTPFPLLGFPHSPVPVPTAPLRLLETPERVDVDLDPRAPQRDPRRIFWRGRALTIANAIGPEQLSGDWWNDGYSRDYWRCESNEEHGELVVYRDDAGWWVQGWYD